MAKEFKDWDKAFSVGEIQYHRRLFLYDRVLDVKEDVYSIERWKFGYEQPDRQQVKEAVYEQPDSREWQQFRVSMKGLSTKEKLFMLEQWLLDSRADVGVPAYYDEVRVNNYIGALKRGGQLDNELNVRR